MNRRDLAAGAVLRISLMSLATLATILMSSKTSTAAPPPDADTSLAPWFHTLRVPGTQVLCCDVSDCRNFPVRADGTHYQVYFENRWLVVPTEAVSDRIDNPTGNYITCIQRDHWSDGKPDGPIVHCLFRAPKT
jgi:hypothetical protein